ncbi:AH receptor-interacting protein [Collichthys lucidus]|uniref:AH receptor-interacting protein n=1 Tax=Collichthys lucidus TaxID=240159 RepID=A0A4U5UDV0_COLLU|nr:AH receptor-interacting protein [Collichthys lucidus]
MEETYLMNHPGVSKKILAGGTGPMPHFPPGTKLVFHFQTLLDNFERTVIDDSRLAGRPAEIFVGKMFKMEVWEPLLMSMRIGEVAEFWCDATVGDPMSYQRESWMMEKDEKLQTVPILHMQGNALVKQRKFREAASKYKEAVLLLKTVQSREMPGDIDYINLGRMILPLELNYCQCMLELEEYYEVIEHTTDLLEKHKGGASVYGYECVCACVMCVLELVWQEESRELKAMSERMKEKYWEEKETYWNMLEKKENKNEEVEDKEKQEDSKDKVEEANGKEEPPSKHAEGHKEEVSPEETGNKEGVGSSEMNPKTSKEAEGKDWQQMLRLVMLLQNEGNFLIREKNFQDASVKFKEAVEYVDVLRNMVDQQADDWESLEKVRLPLTLNLSQCMLELKQYQQVVELNNKLLKKHKGNFKAVYHRAQAHAALCNEDEARRDFDMVEKLDPKFKPFVRQELRKLGERMRAIHAHQNKTYWDTTQEKWGPGGSKAKGAARKKKVSLKATEGKSEADNKTDNGKIEDKESSTKPASAETEGVDDAGAEKNTDQKVEQCIKELESGMASREGLDNEHRQSVMVHEDGQSAPDNQATDNDSNPAATSTGEDNVESKRSTSDKGRKGKCCTEPQVQ